MTARAQLALPLMAPPKGLAYDLRPCSRGEVEELCAKFHAYGSASNTATYAFGVFEFGQLVAGYLWQPPPRGAAVSVCPEWPNGVLALSRMVAVPRAERKLNHVSRPLRRQMLRLIDRGRWPVLVTYSDESLGHTGHVYKCSGWERTRRSRVPVHKDDDGRRVSTYRAGRHVTVPRVGHAWLQRWEHWACPRGEAAEFAAARGWRRRTVPGKFWRSGNQAHEIVQDLNLNGGGTSSALEE